jgi:nitrogen fixation protein NifQ
MDANADARITHSDAVSDRTLCQIVDTLLGPDGPEARFSAEVDDRRVEYDAIVEMLLTQVTEGVSRERAEAVARAVASGCLGEQHLWRDLQLPTRAALRALLETYFEPFAADNVMDMRWKKYIYRKLCRWGGFHTCKAPSCGVCSSYAECFGTES